MPLHLTTSDILLRLILATCAGAVLGLNRSEHGQVAGMRTTILVCLAAALSMILANLLLDQRGKPSDSFVILDLMRLPLGILSGIGFIGAGAIFRRGDMVRGVTTAATLWYITGIGLCLGTGMIWLGIGGVVLGWIVLGGMKYLEDMIPQNHAATLVLTFRSGHAYDRELRRRIEADGGQVQKWSVHHLTAKNQQAIRCIIQRRLLPGDVSVPDYVESLSREAGVVSVKWEG